MSQRLRGHRNTRRLGSARRRDGPFRSSPRPHPIRPRYHRLPHPPPPDVPRGLALGLSLLFLTLPCLASCGQRPPPTTRPPQQPAAVPPGIRFRGLDHEYRGSSTVQPDQTLRHQKESHD